MCAELEVKVAWTVRCIPDSGPKGIVADPKTSPAVDFPGKLPQALTDTVLAQYPVI